MAGKVCTHCGQYAAEVQFDGKGIVTANDLCGNCLLLTPEQREKQKNADRIKAKKIADAEAAAKQAYIDALHEENSQFAAEVTGEDNKSKRKGVEI